MMSQAQSQALGDSVGSWPCPPKVYILLEETDRKAIIASCEQGLCQTAQAAITKHHGLRGLNNRNVFSHHSGDLTSKIELLAGLS